MTGIVGQALYPLDPGGCVLFRTNPSTPPAPRTASGRTTSREGIRHHPTTVGFPADPEGLCRGSGLRDRAAECPEVAVSGNRFRLGLPAHLTFAHPHLEPTVDLGDRRPFVRVAR